MQIGGVSPVEPSALLPVLGLSWRCHGRGAVPRDGAGAPRPRAVWSWDDLGLKHFSVLGDVMQRLPLWQVGWELPDTPSTPWGRDKGKRE